MDDLDHRNLGVKLELWHLQEAAPGMVFWHPRGHAVYRVLEDYLRRKMRRSRLCRGPDATAAAKGVLGPQRPLSSASTCFGSTTASWRWRSNRCRARATCRIFNKGLRSWRVLPIRYAEFGACLRNEPSGSLHGIMRTHAFEQDDAHVFCREEDVEREVACFIALLGEVYRELGFSDFEVAMATRPAARAGGWNSRGFLWRVKEIREPGPDSRLSADVLAQDLAEHLIAAHSNRAPRAGRGCHTIARGPLRRAREFMRGNLAKPTRHLAS